MNEHLIPSTKEKLIFKDFELTNENLLRPEVRQIYEVCKEVKKPLQSYSSAKSLKKTLSKPNLRRQSSSPYLRAIDSSMRKPSRSKSPKRKNKSVDIIKLKNHNLSQVGVRSKFGVSFENVKKSTGDIFNKLPHYTYKKDKENNQSQFLKKKKIAYAYLKA